MPAARSVPLFHPAPAQHPSRSTTRNSPAPSDHLSNRSYFFPRENQKHVINSAMFKQKVEGAAPRSPAQEAAPSLRLSPGPCLSEEPRGLSAPTTAQTAAPLPGAGQSTGSGAPAPNSHSRRRERVALLLRPAPGLPVSPAPGRAGGIKAGQPPPHLEPRCCLFPAPAVSHPCWGCQRCAARHCVAPGRRGALSVLQPPRQRYLKK